MGARLVSSETFLAGQLLLAMPGIGDPRFEQAVIAICLHAPDGAFGIGIGHVLPGMRLHGLLEQVGIAPGEAPDAPLHAGGPMEPERGFVLHSPEWRGEDTLRVSDTLALTSTLDVLRAIAGGNGPRHWQVSLGYAGWGEQQLDGELARHGWFTAAASGDLMFGQPAEKRWAGAFAAEGIDVRLLASASGRA